LKFKLTLKIKFILLAISLVITIMATVIYLFIFRQIDENRQNMEQHMSQLAQNIASMQLLDEQNWTAYQEYISQLSTFNRDIVYIAIYDNRQTLRAFTLNRNLIELENTNISRREEVQIIKLLDSGGIADENRDDLHTVLVDIQMGERILGSVHVGFSLIAINRTLQNNITLNIFLAIIFILIFSLFAILISQKLTRPLEDLKQAMKNVQKGIFETKVSVKTEDEIADLSITFNSMLDFMRERQIIDALGDEVKTIFRLETLAPIVRERLKSAIGAGHTRLYIRIKDNPKQLTEITHTNDPNLILPLISLDKKTELFFKKNPNGFMIQSISKELKTILKHDLKKENGLAIPLIIKNELFGLIYFSLPENKEAFTEKEQRFAITLTDQAALALENAFLYEELQEQERLKRELEIAKQIQQKLLPASIPSINGYDLDAICETALEVGGDYYDFFKISDHKTAMVIADVSGKGAFASFYMAELKGMMLQLAENNYPIDDLVKELNKKLYFQLEKYAFITMVYGILDSRSNTFSFTRSGHTPPVYIQQSGDHRLLEPSGIGLGLEQGHIFNEQLEKADIKLQEGDCLVLYTDGLNEAMDKNYKEYGMKRIISAVKANQNNDAQTILKAINRDAKAFMGSGRKYNDDMTLIVIKRNLKSN